MFGNIDKADVCSEYEQNVFFFVNENSIVMNNQFNGTLQSFMS